MSYVLLAVEYLLASLLFSAIFIGLAWRRRHWAAIVPIMLFGIIVSLGPLAFLLFFVWVTGSTLFWPIVLAGCTLGGVGTLVFCGGRHDASARTWPLVRLGISFCVAITLLTMTWWNLNLQTQVEIQAVRAQAGAIVLEVIPPQVPDSMNAAPLYQQANSMVGTWEVDYQSMDPRSPEVTAFLARQTKALEIFRRAADLPAYRPDMDYSRPDVDSIVKQLGTLRGAANLLAIAARSEATDGHVELALQDCNRIAAAGTHAGSSPMLISGLVAVAIDALAQQTRAKILPFVTRKEQLAVIAPSDVDAMGRLFKRALRGDEAYGLAAYCDFASGNNRPDLVGSGSRVGSVLVWVQWLVFDVREYEQLMHQYEQIALLPYYQTADQRHMLEQELQPENLRGVLNRILMPSLSRSLQQVSSDRALQSGLEVALTATRYRLDHGAYPETGEGLLPGYLEKLPLDPFDGKPLRLKRNDDGSLTIYSVGQDGVDNGGEVESKNGSRQTDVGVVLHAPAAK